MRGLKRAAVVMLALGALLLMDRPWGTRPVHHAEWLRAGDVTVRAVRAGKGDTTLVFIHVADGFAARNLKTLDLRESEEMQADRAYLEEVADAFEAEGFDAEALLATGDPGREIANAAEREQVDLIAMSTHGHRFLNDLVRGSVANDVRHATRIPVLLVRGKAERTGEFPAIRDLIAVDV